MFSKVVWQAMDVIVIEPFYCNCIDIVIHVNGMCVHELVLETSLRNNYTGTSSVSNMDEDCYRMYQPTDICKQTGRYYTSVSGNSVVMKIFYYHK